MLLNIFLYGVIFVVFFTTSIFFKVDINYSDFKEYVLVLLNVSGMVFTLMGIWIAFLYPNALSRIVDPKKIENVDFTESLSEAKRLESIVASVLKSALVVVSVMLIFLVKMLFSNSTFYFDYHFHVKSVAVSLVALLSFVQMESVFHVIKSNVMFINDLHVKREDREADLDV